jgi:hypothetical protein
MRREIKNNCLRRLLRLFAVLGVLVCGVAAIRAAHAGIIADTLQPVVDRQIDRWFPGGDNHPAKAVAETILGILTGDPEKALTGAAKASLPSSTASEEQDTPLARETIHDQKVVPVSPANENAIPQHSGSVEPPDRPDSAKSEPSVGVPPAPSDVHNPVASFSPFGIGELPTAAINAIVQTLAARQGGGGGVFGGGAGLFIGSVGMTGSVPSDVGVSHSGDHGQSNGGAVAHGGGWAGKDSGAAGHADTMVASR